MATTEAKKTTEATETPERFSEIILKDKKHHREYRLDFTLDAIAYAQSVGFNWDDIVEKSAVMIPLIWYTAFRRYQPRMSKNETDKVLKDIGGMSVPLVTRLRQLWEQALSELVADGDEIKNADWEMNL